MTVPFNLPNLEGNELAHVQAAIASRQLAGNGPFTERCEAWLEAHTGAPRALLTHSCTGALELAALLLDVGPGDEVIMPSYTFVSTANAFVLRGAAPVFVDVRSDTLNLDEALVEAAITGATRAIVPVHYGGVACEMDALVEIGARRGLPIVADAAQALGAGYRGCALAGLGELATLSFHESKNLVAGEGGALVLNDPALIERAEILQEKGTNRRQFFRGEVDKYTWLDVGSSFLAGELAAALLWAQLERAEEITAARRWAWGRYQAAFADLEAAGILQRPHVPEGCEPNGHIYFLLLPDEEARDALLAGLAARGVNAATHYVPLHSSPAGRRFGRVHGGLPVTEAAGAQLLRLPLWAGIPEADVDHVITAVRAELAALGRGSNRAGRSRFIAGRARSRR